MIEEKYNFEYDVERFADLQILRYRLNGFETLPLNQKLYIYYLSQASLWGRDIITDQKCRYNLPLRDVLEQIYLYLQSTQDKYPASEVNTIRTYIKQFWFSNGIHHHYSTDKIESHFSESFLREVLADAKIVLPQNLPLDELIRIVFDKTYLNKGVCTAEGKDVVVNSASNYYEAVTQKEAEAYYESMKTGDTDPMWGLNSKLIKTSDGTLNEEVCRLGGRYSFYIENIITCLSQARRFAENEDQKKLIDLLVSYYTTGDLRTFDEYSIEWIKETSGNVDFINGFIEVYGDPLGIKASWEGIVHYKDIDATQRTQKISSNAQWFEDNSPTDTRFKKKNVKGVTANVVRAAMLGGDEYPSTAIGINLPNSEWIRAKHGSKSITISNITEAYNKAARGNGFREEFVYPDAELLYCIDEYSDVCDDLHTDLHECLGHGSGQLLPGVSSDALKNYGSTIEEARADLYGLYFMADKKLVELGLLPDNEAYKSQYYTYMMNGLLTQLTRIKLGDVIEEAHMRNRALIANWVYERAKNEKVMSLVKIDGKIFLQINDYEAVRQYISDLLCEIQRIKSEGDFNAARDIVEKYGVKIDAAIHAEILERYEKLNLSPYKGFVNPVLKQIFAGNECEVVDVVATYNERFDEQMLRYSKEYSVSKTSE